MTDMTSSLTRTPAKVSQDPVINPYKVEETHWGYIVRATETLGRGVAIAQSVSRLLGCAFLAAAIGLWLLPSMLFGADAMFMRFFATIVFVSLATLLLWYATRGGQSEIQIDLSRGEIREVVRNRTNKQILFGSYGFDSVGAVELAPGINPAEMDLVLRYRNTGGCLIMASGREADLSLLRDRLSRDVIVGSSAAKLEERNAA
ncbi:MAG: hypothetical protein AAFQ64_11590 [Pseudomonadota bacterium]